MKKILITIICAITLTAAFVIKGTLTGHVYIATNAGTSIPLAQIDIIAIDYDLFKAHLIKKKDEYTETCPTIEEIELSVTDGRDDFIELNDRHAYCTSPAFYFEGMPDFKSVTTSNVTTSNIDGSYSLKVLRLKKQVIVAKAVRQVPFGDTEHYYWVTPVDLGIGLSEELDLSNRNLLRYGLTEILFPTFF